MPESTASAAAPTAVVDAGQEPFGIYIHIPFCRHRCDYCAFAAWDDRQDLVPAYLTALDREVARAVDAGMPRATSVFVGGGTPSRVDPERLGAVLDRLWLGDGAEVTVECNPDDVTPHLMATLVAHGVNRISIGVQSMDPEVLVGLGRRHVPANVVSAVETIRGAGVASFNVDLIYGAAGETHDTWRSTLESVLALEPPHVSAYALTVEAGTPLAAQPDRHPDEDLQADLHAMADSVLSRAGRHAYEISNWALPGHETLHHLTYWDQGDYRGFGCAAHSHARGRRWWNLRTPERYVAAVDREESVEAAHEVLEAPTRRLEALQLRLRTGWGVPEAAFDAEELEMLRGEAIVVAGRPGRVVLTPRGRMLANAVSMRLLPVTDVPQLGHPVTLPG